MYLEKKNEPTILLLINAKFFYTVEFYLNSFTPFVI